MGDRRCRYGGQGMLDHLSEMVFIPGLYRHGLGVPGGFRDAVEYAAAQRFSLAAGRRDRLYGRRRHLRTETADLQCQT